MSWADDETPGCHSKRYDLESGCAVVLNFAMIKSIRITGKVRVNTSLETVEPGILARIVDYFVVYALFVVH